MSGNPGNPNQHNVPPGETTEDVGSRERDSSNQQLSLLLPLPPALPLLPGLPGRYLLPTTYQLLTICLHVLCRLPICHLPAATYLPACMPTLATPYPTYPTHH